ncbi:hypothetical protein CCR75_001772 [Bremia lactucae]|uniref:Fibronectin type-III domain-containing protein n=1 Tax=Bremia lactucae TaxID=4779 RepID=A0A976NXF0_BRELC|nr:hypothetical protein CCR75_001772 [Bremia lactucae]
MGCFDLVFSLAHANWDVRLASKVGCVRLFFPLESHDSERQLCVLVGKKKALEHLQRHAFYAGPCARLPGIKTLYETMYLHRSREADDSRTTVVFPVDMEMNTMPVRQYPLFPHPPLLVAVGTCDAISLRWRGLETLEWPIERFILERYPNSDDLPVWTTLLDDKLFELVDEDVKPKQQYIYRVQTISRANVSSAYDFQWVELPERKSTSSSASFVSSLDADGISSLGLLFACFLTVYGLMRASVMGAQGTQSRKHRLKRIRKSTSEEVVPEGGLNSLGQGASAVIPRHLSTSTSSWSRSIEAEPSQRGSIFDTTTTPRNLSTRARSSVDTAQTPLGMLRLTSRSLSTMNEKATACQHCHKRFRLFRKRYLCDICHSVSLCRKCGYQASVDSIANAQRGLLTDPVENQGNRSRRSYFSQQQHKKLKIRTICRDCCDDMFSPSTQATGRPPYVSHKKNS